MPNAEITLSEHSIHNPSDPRHFMRLKRIAQRVRILRDGAVLAESKDALRLLEVGRDFYDPTIYVPATDVLVPLSRTEKSTHCPLKGDAVYFCLTDLDGAVIAVEIAWSYPEPLDIAADLAGRVAFYADKVTVEESPL